MFFVAGAASDTRLSPAVMTLALSIVPFCLELSGARSAPQAAAPVCLRCNAGKLVNQQDVSPLSCLMGAGNERQGVMGVMGEPVREGQSDNVIRDDALSGFIP